jgi:hypothetical protein
MMDDLYLEADVGDDVIFVTPLSHKMYRQANGQGFGGSEGYFICSSSKKRPDAGFEILAKTVSFEAAQQIFSALTGGPRRSVA